MKINKAFLYTSLMIIALFAFEIFNYAITRLALTDLVGNINLVGIRWSTILAIAFCLIDFVGINKYFLDPEDDASPAVWYLFGAWSLSAMFNAVLTWWGVTLVLSNLPASPLQPMIPLLVAVVAFLIRVLIVGTMLVTGNRPPQTD